MVPALALGDASTPVDRLAVTGVPATGALAYEVGIELAHEQSCSQSFMSTSEHGRLKLTVTPDGRARLWLDVESNTTSGSSPGRFTEGAQVRRDRSRIFREWSGTARRSGGLTVTLETVRTADVQLPEYGVVKVSPKLSAQKPASGHLTCQVRATEVLGPLSDKGERGKERVSLLACQSDVGFPALDGVSTLTFAGAAGIALHRDSWSRSYEAPALVRVER